MSSGDENDFKPRLGRIRSLPGSGAQGMKAFLKASRRRSPKASTASKRSAGFAGARRVVIQAKFVRLSGKGMGLQRAHLSYLQRDGAGRDNERADFYNEKGEDVDGREWLEEHREDRHHFRFIVSPEDGQQLDDLKPFVRELVGQMEIDLETKLDWIAVDHHNTEHPHTHIVMSGRRDDGRDLIIPREYLSHGMRERGSAILTRELGLQTEREVSAKLAAEIGQRKMTRMDRVLARQMREHGEVDLSRVKRNGEHYSGRLKNLRKLGLAEHVGGTRWSVDNQLGSKLAEIEYRDTIAARIEGAVREAGLDRIGAHQDGQYTPYESVRGRLLKIGRADELHNNAYAVIDGLDGRVHHFDLGTSYTDGLKAGDMIESKPRAHGALVMDEKIEKIAEGDDNRLYSPYMHRQYDPQVSKDTLRRYQRRVDALIKANLAKRFSTDTAHIPPDFLDRVNEHFERLSKRSPTIMRPLEGMEFENQVQARGETWLDRQLAGDRSETIGHAGLGGDVRAAMGERAVILGQRGFTADRQATSLSTDELTLLRNEGLEYAAADIAHQTGLTYRALKQGDKLEGTFKQTYKTPNTEFAIVQRGKEFSLVPWSKDLEKMRSQQIEITMSRGMTLSWTRGRSRGLGR